MAAVITLGFDPLLRLGELHVRWQALGVAAAVLAALLVAAVGARRAGRLSGLRPLRRDDLLYICLGVLPGAVVGGRLLHALAYADVYAADPGALVDTTRGGLSLLGALLGGSLTGAYISRLIDGATGRWADLAAVPLLVALGLGKLAQLVAGGGQGEPFDGPWSVAFVGAGPWLSPQAGQPAHPAQVYEALWAFAGIPLVLALLSRRLARRLPSVIRQEGAWASAREDRLQEVDRGALRFGFGFLAALAWWLVGRALIGAFWRDEALVGPLNMEQAMALVALLSLLVAVLLVAVIRPGRESREERWHTAHHRWRARGPSDG
jgi:phosphatidylglycerol:prolipoprotein diacylglycerol transferase